MIDIEKFNEYANRLNLKLIDDINLKEISKSDKLTFIDNEYYKFYLSFDNIKVLIGRNGTPAKFFYKNKFTKYNIENYLKINNIYLEIVNFNVARATDNILWKCKVHNKEFLRSWNSVKNGQITCSICGRENFRNKMGHSIDYIKETGLKMYGITILDENYINNETKLHFICNKHKDFGVQKKTWNNIISKSHPCLCCSKEKHLKKVTKSQEIFEEEVKMVHGDKYKVVSKYKKSSEKVTVYCNKCKTTFSIKASHLLNGVGCGNCIKSKGEERVERFLINNNFTYKREYKFDKCKGINHKLPFDFYLPELNTCIEYDGKQHFEPIERFGGVEGFTEQKKNDNIKTEFCKNNNIKLIRIPYYDYKNIETILSKELIN